MLNNWKLLAIAIPSALLALQVLSWRSEALKVPGLESALSNCEAGKRITTEANDALQKDRNTIAARLAAAKRVRANCVLVSSPANPGETRAEHARRNEQGISSHWLLDYAAVCEQYRSERIVLEKFIADERR